MFQRRISGTEVQQVLASGETVESYPGDTPYPSRLVLGWHGSRPLHVVVADNEEDQETIVITVYEPKAEDWDDGYKRRK
jgi:hypothetical protein